MNELNKAGVLNRTWSLLSHALLLAAIGGYLFVSGIQLVLLKGSAYYVLVGSAFLLSAVLIWRGRVLGAKILGLALLGTLAWAIWEVGFDLWPLIPRIGLPLVLAIWLFLPTTRRTLHSASGAVGIPFWLMATLGIVISIVLGAGLHTFVQEPHDPVFRRGVAQPSIKTAIEKSSGTYSLLTGEWHHYGNDPGGQRFSPLTQITPDNVGDLEVAWIYNLGKSVDGQLGDVEATPLMVEDSLYFCTSYNDVIALDAETGHERWRFRSGIRQAIAQYGHCRGVTYYKLPEVTGACSERIYTATLDARLIALDAHTGERCAEFGVNGEVSLLAHMGEVGEGYYFVTSAPTLVRGRLVLGGWVADSQYWGEPPGVIRAFDARSGELSWAFDPGRPDRQDAPPSGETYTLSTPNSWAPMSADESLGLVYVPTGNATPDYYGAQRRPFDDKYSSAVVALDAETGRVRWSFQTTHHDLWDYDVPSQPTLIDISTSDGVRRALIQPTKRGELFVLDRVTGKPIAEVEERPAPQAGKAPTERLSPTQPFSVGMPSLAGPILTERSAWGITPLDQLWCRITFRQTRYQGYLTPPGLDSWNLVYPGYAGGSNWGGVTYDPVRQLLFARSTRLAVRSELITREEANALGIRAMSSDVHSDIAGAAAQENTPYAVKVAPFLSPLGIPCQEPPWGMLTAIDMKSRQLLWTHPLGTLRDSGPFGIRSHLPLRAGVPGMGGSMATGSGLVFIGASLDAALRAYRAETGELLWEKRLPAGGQSTPMTYLSPKSGRQFVVIGATGHGFLGSRRGDYVIAYALSR